MNGIKIAGLYRIFHGWDLGAKHSNNIDRHEWAHDS